MPPRVAPLAAQHTRHLEAAFPGRSEMEQQTTVTEPSWQNIPPGQNVGVPPHLDFEGRQEQPNLVGQAVQPAVSEQQYIPDLPISMLQDPSIKQMMRSALANLATETAPDARLEDDAAELLLYVANDFISTMANFSCRLANHRRSENVDAPDLAVYLEKVHGMRIPQPPPPQTESEPQIQQAPSTSVPQTVPPVSLARGRPRRQTNPVPQEHDEEDEEDEEDDAEEDEDDNDEQGEENEEEEIEEKPRESRRLRERAQSIAEKPTRGRKRGRPRKA